MTQPKTNSKFYPAPHVAISTWSQKHDEYCLEMGLKPSAKLLWQWLATNPNADQEPDLNEFNFWVTKHRGRPFHRDTLKMAVAQLEECGVLKILKKFTWRILRVVVRNITWLIKPPQLRKKSRSEDCDRDPCPSNPQSVEDEVIAAAALDITEEQAEILTVCDEVGIQYAEPQNILAYPLSEVKAAIQHFLNRGGNLTDSFGQKRIVNPQGWLISCLKRRWWQESQTDEYYSPEGGRLANLEEVT